MLCRDGIFCTVDPLHPVVVLLVPTSVLPWLPVIGCRDVDAIDPQATLWVVVDGHMWHHHALGYGHARQ